MSELVRLQETERWIAYVRLGGVAFAVLQVALATGYPRGYERDAWILTAVFAVGAVALYVLSRRRSTRGQFALGIGALAFDTAVLSAYLLVYNFEIGSPVRQVLYLAVIEAAVRFGIAGPLVVSAVTAPVLVEFERVHARHLHEGVRPEYVTYQIGSQVIVGLIVGWLVLRLQHETRLSDARAREAERLHDAERRTVEELRRLSALRADFVSLVSHELRSPMAAVIGSARTLQQRWRELATGQREALLALIADETSRLANLVSEVLDTSRIEAGTFSYTFGDVDLAKLVDEAVATATVGQDEVTVRATARAVPLIRGDRERLRQVLSNLIDNAVKYSSAGESVDVELSSANENVVVAVRDRGPGIPEDQQRLIFEKFGRAQGGGAKPGTGLGLFIARSIVEAHGGTLDVTSAPGRGSTFILELPLEPRERS